MNVLLSARSRGFLAVSAAIVMMTMAGCSQQSDSAKPSSQSEVTKTARAWDVAFAQCLREAGMDVKDPDGTMQGLNIENEDQQRALGECKKKTTETLGERPVSDAEQQSNDDLLDAGVKTAECLRSKGYDVADPTQGDDGTIKSGMMPDVPDDIMKACSTDS